MPPPHRWLRDQAAHIPSIYNHFKKIDGQTSRLLVLVVSGKGCTMRLIKNASSQRHLPIDTTRLWIRLEFYAHPSSASAGSYLMASTTTSSLDFPSILDAALDSYTRLTGIDLTTHPSVHRLQNCHSPNAVLQLLQEREMSFRDYRDGHRTLINWLLPVVQIVHAFSGALGEVAGGLPVVSAEPHGLNSTFDCMVTRPVLGITTTYMGNLCRHRCSPHGAWLPFLTSSGSL